MRRVACRRCDAVVVQQVPWTHGKRVLTRTYTLFLARWARKLSWKETADSFRTSREKVFDAVEHGVTFGLQHRVLGQIDAIGVYQIVRQTAAKNCGQNRPIGFHLGDEIVHRLRELVRVDSYSTIFIPRR